MVFASRLAPTGARRCSVGAGLPARRVSGSCGAWSSPAGWLLQGMRWCSVGAGLPARRVPASCGVWSSPAGWLLQEGGGVVFCRSWPASEEGVRELRGSGLRQQAGSYRREMWCSVGAGLPARRLPASCGAWSSPAGWLLQGVRRSRFGFRCAPLPRFRTPRCRKARGWRRCPLRSCPPGHGRWGRRRRSCLP
ncbi:hypothetical protein SAMN05216203_1626 [Marinobacter daqiaonensis]|uniref:Uncharacterized protein n=1 Tax=Marinobacter daqiaonensis TaxID=650891 RepID=A0A1I6HX76_9GAMM|nr:hypothetical protein SAMN05216203_1626 [Marinobacter daqiaonensis]